jgi:CheY-like chemotaxis protein
MGEKIKTVLLEDHPHLRQMLTILLETRGHEVSAFHSLDYCRFHVDDPCHCPHEEPCCDILISDLRMPFLSGLELVRRQTERGCKGKVHNKMLISSSISAAEEEEARTLGLAVMRKFNTSKLFKWIAEVEKRLKAGGAQGNFAK